MLGLTQEPCRSPNTIILSTMTLLKPMVDSLQITYVKLLTKREAGSTASTLFQLCSKASRPIKT